MKPIAMWIVLTFILLLAAPTLALPQGRWDDREYPRRIENKEAAYWAGYNDGYREGMRLRDYDLHHHLRSGSRYREYEHGYGFYGHNSRYQGEYRKGFKKGYREGCRNAYREYRGHRWH